MAIHAVSITKRCSWRGTTEEFSNVYHFFSATNWDETQAETALDALADNEKLIHTSQVTFISGRVWRSGSTPAANITILLKDLSGTGSLTNSGGMFKESTVVCRIDTTRNTSTGRKIYLRKYFHSCGLPSGSTGMYQGDTALTSTQTGPFEDAVEAVRELTLDGGLAVFLCAPGGQLVDDTNPVSILPYLHTRQFRG